MTLYLEQIGFQSTQSGPARDHQRVMVTGVRAAFTEIECDPDDTYFLCLKGSFLIARWAFCTDWHTCTVIRFILCTMTMIWWYYIYMSRFWCDVLCTFIYACMIYFYMLCSDVLWMHLFLMMFMQWLWLTYLYYAILCYDVQWC